MRAGSGGFASTPPNFRFTAFGASGIGTNPGNASIRASQRRMLG